MVSEQANKQKRLNPMFEEWDKIKEYGYEVTNVNFINYGDERGIHGGFFVKDPDRESKNNIISAEVKDEKILEVYVVRPKDIDMARDIGKAYESMFRSPFTQPGTVKIIKRYENEG